MLELKQDKDADGCLPQLRDGPAGSPGSHSSLMRTDCDADGIELINDNLERLKHFMAERRPLFCTGVKVLAVAV